MLKHVLFCCIFAIFHIIYLTVSESPQTYGEFTLKIRKLDICKGPKRSDCINFSAKVVNETILIVDLDVKKDVRINRGKVLSSMNNKPLVRLQMKNPCDHFFMKYFFRTIYNIQNCEFKKGNYTKHIDIAEIATKYYGGMFLYGNMTFKALFYNDECNFSCVDVQVIFSPKNNNTTI